MADDPRYYHHVRAEIAPLLPAAASRIVDVGCGAGATLAWLGRRYPAAHTIGLEGNPAVADELRGNAREVHILDLNRDDPDLGAPDLILFLDVLEHLPDPAETLRRLTARLAPGGTVIVSVPNVAHWSVALPLLFRGEFTYRDKGILDRTHLRFFVQSSALDLVSDAGLVADRGLIAGVRGLKGRLADALTLGQLRRRLAEQFIIRAKLPDSTRPGPVIWSLAEYS